jgi:hypothetical protein
MADLLTNSDLPAGFRYPPEFIRAVELGIVDLEPWFVLTGDYLLDRYLGMRERYPRKTYIPFAEKQDTVDFACWTGPSAQVTLVHDFASPGWELRSHQTWPNFHAWLREAVDDYIEWSDGELRYAAVHGVELEDQAEPAGGDSPMPELLSDSELPAGFAYPPELLRAVEYGLLKLEPWWVLHGDDLRFKAMVLKDRYRKQVYVPFADRQDSDDVACLTGAGSEVLIVHDFASPGWEARGRGGWPNFHAWLRQAVEDYIEWGEMELHL